MSKQIAKYIDHTLLKGEATKKEIIKLCEEARENQFASVCVNPTWVHTCAQTLKGSGVGVCTVVGFPLGATTSEVKAFETRNAIQNGATEVDMVLNVGALKEGNYQLVEDDVRAVVEAANNQAIVKVIIEACLLTDEEKVKACEICLNAGAHFVKTSTGFSSGGATVEDVTLMKQTVGEQAEVKAAGGVRNLKDALKMIDAGATRIGTSGGVAIVQGQAHTTGY